MFVIMSKGKSSKINVKDYLESDQVDLSLQSFTPASLPVKDIAAIKKGKKLDLSKNQIVSLPDNFVPSMGHIVKLDLSSNKLTELPETFGNLSLLQHLDLFDNSLTKLPVGFFKLKLLQWLDVKENPLEYPSPDVVGLCRNNAECKASALQVIEFMKKENAEHEKRKQKELELKRAKKEALKRELERLEEMEREEKKRIKQEEKSREKAKRRAEYEEKQKLKAKEQPSAKAPSVIPSKTENTASSAKLSLPSIRTVALVSSVLVLTLAVVMMTVIQPDMEYHYQSFLDLTGEVQVKVSGTVNPIITSLNSQLLQTMPGLQRSIVSAYEILSEMLVICRDTLIFGFDLAQKEVKTFSVSVQKYMS